ncbi:hypothetical protein [Helicobacter saguini]|uniref:hypothetical protein n=1 Tax=Helicobacter saguini TaxID=1548018 RepID=UPI000AE3D942|nr:hypothetical protein [Helicobacter saguini]
MWKLLENIGLGLFVNATYSLLMNFEINKSVIATLLLSIGIMSIAIFFERRTK